MNEEGKLTRAQLFVQILFFRSELDYISITEMMEAHNASYEDVVYVLDRMWYDGILTLRHTGQAAEYKPTTAGKIFAHNMRTCLDYIEGMNSPRPPIDIPF